LHRSMRVGSAGRRCIRRTGCHRYCRGLPACRARSRSDAWGSKSSADRSADRRAEPVDPPTLSQVHLLCPRALPMGQAARQGHTFLTFWCRTPRRAPARGSHAVNTRGQRSDISLDVGLKRWSPDPGAPA
jgi:hypothetical protein